MSRKPFIAIGLTLAAGFALVGLAATPSDTTSPGTTQPAATQRPGRAAVIHFTDGTELRCTVLNYSKGELRVEADGQEQTVDFRTVERVTFGEAVGENVLGPLDPGRDFEHEGLPADLDRPEGARRGIEEMARTQRRRGIGLLSRMTDGFKNVEREKAVEAQIRQRLEVARTAGDKAAEKNLLLALATIQVAQDQMQPAGEILDGLKKEYPDDQVLQGLTTERLAQTIARWRRFDANRRPPRRTPPTPPAEGQPEQPPP